MAVIERRKKSEQEFHNQYFNNATREHIAKFYSIVASSQDFYQSLLLASCRGKRVLEYGCGPGTYSFLLANHGAVVTGIDLSNVGMSQAIERARSRHAEATSFCVMDAESLAFRKVAFDLICGRAILHHLDLQRSFSELRRTLKPGGIAIFAEPLGHNPLINLYRRLTPDLRTADEHPLLMKDLHAARRFFGKVEIRYFHLFSLIAVAFHKASFFKGLVNTLDALDRFAFQFVPPLRRHAWSVILILSEPLQPEGGAAGGENRSASTL